MSVTLSPAEVEAASGGYKRPAEQLRELHRRGFYRAYRSKVTGQVILERPHYDAVAAGQSQGTTPANQPMLRSQRLRQA